MREPLPGRYCPGDERVDNLKVGCEAMRCQALHCIARCMASASESESEVS